MVNVYRSTMGVEIAINPKIIGTLKIVTSGIYINLIGGAWVLLETDNDEESKKIMERMIKDCNNAKELEAPDWSNY